MAARPENQRNSGKPDKPFMLAATVESNNEKSLISDLEAEEQASPTSSISA